MHTIGNYTHLNEGGREGGEGRGGERGREGGRGGEGREGGREGGEGREGGRGGEGGKWEVTDSLLKADLGKCVRGRVHFIGKLEVLPL